MSKLQPENKVIKMPYEVKRERCVSCGERLPADIVDIGSQYPSAVIVINVIR